MSESLYERMDALHREIGTLVEDMGATIYNAIENDTLKRVAIDADVDWTREGTKVIEDIGAALQRERDVNRELRRHRDALLNDGDRARGMAVLYKSALHWVVRDDEELGAAVDAWFAAVREMGA